MIVGDQDFYVRAIGHIFIPNNETFGHVFRIQWMMNSKKMPICSLVIATQGKNLTLFGIDG